MPKGNFTAAEQSANPLLSYGWRDLTYVNNTPLDSDKDNKRRVEGLKPAKQVNADPSWYAYGDYDSFAATPMGQLFDKLWRKGFNGDQGGDVAGDLGGFDDDQRNKQRMVYVNTKPIIPGVTAWRVPISDGNAYGRGGDYYYSEMILGVSSDAVARNKAQNSSYLDTKQQPPGPEASAPGQSTMSSTVKEFTALGKIIWTALDAAQSARNASGNPHPSRSCLNTYTGEDGKPMDAWSKFVGADMPSADFYGLSDFAAKGWTGFEQRILSWDGVAAPTFAGEDLGTALAAAEDGDEPALRALAQVGIKPPPQGAVTSWFEDLGRRLF